MFKIICPIVCLFYFTCEIYFYQTFQYMARHCMVSGRYFEPCSVSCGKEFTQANLEMTIGTLAFLFLQG